MPKPQVRTCVSCAHSWKQINQGGRMCGRPGEVRFDLVEGASGRPSSFCEFERCRLWRWFGAKTCGPEGRFWKQKPPLGSPPTSGSAVTKPTR